MPNPPTPPGEELVPCPRGCGTDVRAKNAGNPHSIMVGDKRVTCK